MNAGSILLIVLMLIFLGAAGLCGYEAYAFSTGKDPTLSKIAAYEFNQHPKEYLSVLCLVFFSLGALVTHFFNWRVK